MSDHHHSRLKLWPLLLVLVFAMGLVGCGTQVPSGHRGVFYYKFGDGTEMGKIYPEGFNWHFPWNSMFVYKVQLNEAREDLTVLSSDGATINLRVAREDEKMAGDASQSAFGFDHIGLEVEDIQVAFEDLTTRGYAFFMPPREIPNMKIAFFKGPEDITIELCQPL